MTSAPPHDGTQYSIIGLKCVLNVYMKPTFVAKSVYFGLTEVE